MGEGEGGAQHGGWEPHLLAEETSAWVAKGSDMSDFGGSSLEQLRPWVGSRWLGPTLGVPSCTEPPGAP